ncbi:glycosyl hydrolase family 47-domain-containing protein [Truncatella angustata]|uniref:alpha-1,2-Mannosidase n=1 Tax=Truncatella angustata TaxID=152316 RepID=A0A9P8UIU6_9PEZI|nr:glycosyl hydrolase family 47-domain-containing protein [Truncatella angustata]KAH6652992.1 glycosyl hydrolase family 47-domain-containing protein [Truncatella angustata]
MLRLRRYRVYLALAAVALFLLYRMSQDTDWESLAKPIDYTSENPKEKTTSTLEDLNIQRKRPQQKPLDSLEKENEKATVKLPDLKDSEDDGTEVDYTLPTVATSLAKAEPTTAEDDDETAVDSTTAKTADTPAVVASTKITAPSEIHWTRPVEVFPIKSASLITLPTGTPKTIPTVQHVFKKESPEAQELREKRLAIVKGEAKRAWAGYKKHAWLRDELMPVTQEFKDPFCGWAATLVDALDTLWIMGMKEEFEEAVEAVATIDFTTTTRSEIPVFETTIRYLGGFLGAYDVSGGKEGGHGILLQKAEELAEILMGVFDTPNRMPILYYHWQPAFTGKPKRASTSAGVAELGSLLMEFTRLAQVTNNNKYYDAVARITDALEEWQNRPHGTSIPGIFPEHVDASGCNSTARTNAEIKLSAEQTATVKSVLDPPAGYVGGEIFPESESATDTNTVPELALPAKTKKVLTAPVIPSAPDLYQHMMTDKVTGEPYTLTEFAEVCYPQGLTGAYWGRESFSMGGSQDSTYEYFPKQYLLLGGLEHKYETMHLKVADAVKKWLLYRPMVPDNRDLLFSAKVTTSGKPETDLRTEYEVTHLTCFLGGMFALGGKIFDEPVDVEIGKKLTDGCVWAYESMPTGIMPEAATVVPCAEASNCKWNETLWHQYLDPLWGTRERQIDDYYKRKAERKAKAEKEKQKALELEAEAELDDTAELEDEILAAAPNNVGSMRKRDLDVDSEDLETSSNDNRPPKKTTKKITLEDSVGNNDILLAAGGTGTVNRPARKADIAQIPLDTDEKEDRTKPDPSRPLTHEEYIKQRLTTEKTPPGFVSTQARNYILRPEAIESVWYMYRITGDTTWQEKGWKMFESIIAATQTEAGHSAISNVMSDEPDKNDSMESFWLAETLKYFYLLYTTPDVISLDDWVLNTEAHPFKRPLPV